MSERSGLEERTDLDAVVLDLVQIPIAAWVPVLFLGMFATMFGAALVPPLAFLGAFAFVGTFIAMFAMSWIKPRVRVEITPSEIRLAGWLGRLPWPRREVLPLVGTDVDWHAGALVNNVQVWVLTLTHGERTLIIPSLRCTAEEIDEVVDRVEGMRLLADELFGAGEAEVPAELAAIRAAKRVDERVEP